MKNGVKYPYGVSDYSKLVRDGYYFVDRTSYIEKMEEMGEPYLFFFRPRRFGKSLILSMLQHYYGKEHRESFEELFGQQYIGQNRTANAGKYLILQFDFSGIDTSGKKTTFDDFTGKVKDSILNMMSSYREMFSTEDRKAIEEQKAPNKALSELWKIVKKNDIREKFYVLIDEYDHFTNELMAFRFEEFKEIVTGTGYVRKFFERLKEACQTGFVDRMFMTGVSPVTLDSLTSGFNIGKSISRNPQFIGMAGFTHTEMLEFLKLLPLKEGVSAEGLLPELERWYDGYRFHPEAPESLFNPGMALFFCTEYLNANGFPDDLLDTNIASDYGKIRRLFHLDQPKRNYDILREIVENKQVTARLTKEFSFDKSFSRDDFISLLYYLGLLTLTPSPSGFSFFKVPNYVIEKLFYDYIFSLLEERDKVPIDTGVFEAAMLEMAVKGNPRPFFDFIQDILQHLAKRDYQDFSEKNLKIIIIATALQAQSYYVKSEREVAGGYTDIQFLQRPPFSVHSQFVFELKYVKKKDAATLPAVQKEAGKQLLAYLETEPELNEALNLQAWTVVVVKDEIHLEKYGEEV